MIEQFIQIITNTLGVSLLDFACIIYIFEHCLFKPFVWLAKKYWLGVITNGK